MFVVDGVAVVAVVRVTGVWRGGRGEVAGICEGG